MRRSMDLCKCCLGVAVALTLLLAATSVADQPLERSTKTLVQKAGDLPTTITYKGREYPVHNVTKVRSITAQEGTPLQGPRQTASYAEKSDGLRDVGDFNYVLYEQDAAASYGGDWTFAWGGAYTLDMPPGIPVLTEVELFLVNAQAAGGTTYDPAIILLEFYDTVPSVDDDGVPDVEPYHLDYLGGIALNMGVMEPEDQEAGLWIADTGTYYMALGNDDHVFISAECGTLNGSDQFVATGPETLSLVFAVGDGAAPSVGENAGQMCMDDTLDRIYTDAESCNWVSGDQSRIYLTMTLRGTTVSDCNANCVPDNEEVSCGHEVGDMPDCATESCTYYVDTGNMFTDPLGVGYTVPAACDVDPNSNGLPDYCDTLDCNTNGVLDIVEITANTALDCDYNGILDVCQISKNSSAPGGPFYCDPEAAGACSSGCDPDCNSNGILDACDIADCGTEPGLWCSDCNQNGIPDSCEIASGDQPDCDNNGILDRCERPVFFDCNRNGVEDTCDIMNGDANDLDVDGVPDACAGTVCTTRWNGFEDMADGSVDGVDTDDDGDAWSGPATVGTVQPCSGAKALRFRGSKADGFTNTEYFKGDGNGGTPPPAQSMSLEFDFHLFGSLASTRDLRIFIVDAFGDETAALMWLQSTISTNGVTPGNLHMYNGDTDELDDTGITLEIAASPCVHVELILDTGSQTVELKVDNVSVWTGPTLDEGVGRMDWAQLSSFSNVDGSDPEGTPYTFMFLDNFEICEVGGPIECSAYTMKDGSPGTDCDGDGICDHFQLSGNDRNDNGVLDHCEGYCYDCNNNWIDDALEIAGGTAYDTNTNGIIDACEATDPSETFEAFDVGTNAIGRNNPDSLGWTEFRSVSEIATGGSFGSGKFVKVKGNDDSNGLTLLLGPRVNVADADIENWSWKMRSTGTDFGELYVEIVDMCVDGPAQSGDGQYIFLGDFIDAANTGLNWVTNHVDGLGVELNSGEVLMRMLADDGASGFNRQYENILSPSQTVVPGNLTTAAGYAAGIRVNNVRGATTAFWHSDQTTLFDRDLANNTLLHSIASKTETQGTHTVQTLSNIPMGGDRQIVIRTDGDFGTGQATEFWFDNINYTVDVDCDNDGTPDDEEIARRAYYGLDVDLNDDGIPDWCQDCNNDCNFNVATGVASSASCLDPAEAVGNDCNGNGIPDDCDIDPALPYEAMYTSACFGGPWGSSISCFFSRAGGGSCDLNANGVPDECDAGFVDCNGNGCIDSSEVALGSSADVNLNNIPDECELDCNINGVPDDADIAAGVPVGSQDRAGAPCTPPTFCADGIPDECCMHDVDGDMDDDGDVDAADFKAMQWCAGQKGSDNNQPQGRVAGSAFGGGSPWVGISCGCADLNGDGYVNESDMALFHYFVTGPQ